MSVFTVLGTYTGAFRDYLDELQPLTIQGKSHHQVLGSILTWPLCTEQIIEVDVSPYVAKTIDTPRMTAQR